MERGRDEARGVEVPKEAVEFERWEGGKKEVWECAAMEEEVRGAEVVTEGVGCTGAAAEVEAVGAVWDRADAAVVAAGARTGGTVGGALEAVAAGCG